MRIYSLYKHKLRSHPTQSIIFLFLYFTCSYPTPENLENGNDQAARRWGKVSPRNPSRFSDMFTCALLIYLTCFVKFQTKQGKDRKGRKEKGKEEVDRILSLGNGGTRNGEGGGFQETPPCGIMFTFAQFAGARNYEADCLLTPYSAHPYHSDHLRRQNANTSESTKEQSSGRRDLISTMKKKSISNIAVVIHCFNYFNKRICMSSMKSMKRSPWTSWRFFSSIHGTIIIVFIPIFTTMIQ